MTKDEAIERFCILTSKVRGKVFNNQIAGDCFCSDRPNTWTPNINDGIVNFIEKAVNKAIENGV